MSDILEDLRKMKEDFSRHTNTNTDDMKMFVGKDVKDLLVSQGYATIDDVTVDKSTGNYVVMYKDLKGGL